jgi:hypothetical protein
MYVISLNVFPAGYVLLLTGEHHGKPIEEDGDYSLLFDADTINMEIGIQGEDCSDKFPTSNEFPSLCLCACVGV